MKQLLGLLFTVLICCAIFFLLNSPRLENFKRRARLLEQTKPRECSICMDDSVSNFMTRCRHHFHQECLNQCLHGKTTCPCPMCRTSITGNGSLEGLLAGTTGISISPSVRSLLESHAWLDGLRTAISERDFACAAFLFRCLPLSIAQRLLLESFNPCDLNAIKFLVDNGAGGEDALLLAMMRDNLDILDIFINTYRDTPNQKGETPLHLAATYGRLNAIKRLVQRGADIEATDNNGCTPLHRAIQVGNIATVKTLLNLGASILARDHWGATSLHFAAGHSTVEMVQTVLDYQQDINAITTSGYNALSWAIRRGDPKLILLLYNNGARLLEKDACLLADLVSKRIIEPEQLQYRSLSNTQRPSDAPSFLQRCAISFRDQLDSWDAYFKRLAEIPDDTVRLQGLERRDVK